ncbi:MAG: response regulator [Desulfobulbaceae bacterium]|nr:response regulator [Desulfobulbaceae bacterium]
MRSLVLHHFAIYFVILVLSALSFNGLILFHVLHLHANTLAAQQNRQESLQVTHDIQQETAALSRMVRAYTTSANTKYLNYYYDIIDIRQGKKASPEAYDATYWAKVMAGELPHVMPKDSPGVSLLERMEKHGFSQEEFAAIDEVLRYSILLYEQDQIAFAATQGLYDPDRGIFIDDGKPQLQFANQFVYSANYLKLESKLSQEVRNFVSLTDERTSDAVQDVSIQLRRSIFAAVVILGITVAIVLIAMNVIRKMVLAPLKSLMNGVLELGRGDYSQRTDTGRGVHELQALGQTFNGMADNIQEDIQQREQIQKALEVATVKAEESTKAKSLFLANMSHEIRTPMNAIIGMTYLALKTDLDERQRDYIGKIKVAAQSLLGIINDILDFSKIEAGKLQFDHIAFRLEDVVSNTLTLLRQRTVEKGLELLLDIKNPQLLGDAGTYLGDPLRLGQVLTNLLTNAVKFTNQGYVKISVEECSRQEKNCELRFCIEDTGIGMTPAQMSQLFQEFSQVDGTTTRKQGGTGLGLSISKRLVAQMGGTLTVTSQHHQGSQFTCALTLQAPAQIEGALLDVVPQGLKALIVDDHEPARTVLHSLLGHFGVASVEVDSGEAALRLLAETEVSFDIIFIDWVMPGMGGEELIAAIRKLLVQKSPLLVVVSAYDLERIHVLCGQQKICRFLPKPVLPTELRKLFWEVLHPHAVDEKSALLPGTKELEGMRVLLAEDNLVNQQVSSELLAYSGVEVELANNGQEAIAMISEHPDDYYHAVLMDIQMPVMDGYEATRILRSQSRYAALPIIAMTAHVMVEEQQRCLAAGMQTHIAKPIEPVILLRVLAEHYPRSLSIDNALRQTAGPENALPLGGVSQQLLPGAILGVDFTVGLNLCGHKPALYRQILKGFVKEYEHFSSTLQQLLHEEKWSEIFNLVHTFKGLAGTIGAQGLYQLSVQVEQGAKAHTQHLDLLVMELTENLSCIIEAINTYFAEEEELYVEPVSLPDTTDTTPDATLLLAQLRHLLQESDSAAQDLWRNHEATLKTKLPTATADGLSQAIANFQFQDALAQLPQENCL